MLASLGRARAVTTAWMAVSVLVSSAHANPVPVNPAAPFGPGASVQISSGGEPVTVFVARRDPTSPYPPGDTDFVKIGKTPLEVMLPPGSYQIEVQGHGISHEALAFEMRGEPRRLFVSPGDEGLGVLGTLSLGIGITAVAAATAILVSGSGAPEKLDKPAIVIPMYVAGGVLLGAGIGLSIASDTDIDEQPNTGLRAQRSGPALGLGARFSF